MAEYAKRDQKIDQLRCELNHRKELLAGKLGKLSEASKVNSMLEGVVEDYKKHTQQVVEEKNRQDKALRDILEHLNKVMEDAVEMYPTWCVIDAREVYLEVAEAGYKSENLFKKLGDSYYFNGDLPKSVKWYEELYKLKEGKLEEDYLFRYAMALKSAQRYDESDEMMLEFEKIK